MHLKMKLSIAAFLTSIIIITAGAESSFNAHVKTLPSSEYGRKIRRTKIYHQSSRGSNNNAREQQDRQVDQPQNQQVASKPYQMTGNANHHQSGAPWYQIFLGTFMAICAMFGVIVYKTELFHPKDEKKLNLFEDDNGVMSAMV